MAGMISARMISAGVASVGMIWVGILRRVVAALTATALLMLTGAVHAAPPVEPDQPDFAVLNRDVAPLSPRLRQAVLLDPKVAEATARACQLTHRLGLARAAGRPKVNASISGTRQIKSKIKKIPSWTRVTENGRTRLVKPRGYDEKKIRARIPVSLSIMRRTTSMTARFRSATPSSIGGSAATVPRRAQWRCRRRGSTPLA